MNYHAVQVPEPLLSTKHLLSDGESETLKEIFIINEGSRQCPVMEEITSIPAIENNIRKKKKSYIIPATSG